MTETPMSNRYPNHQPHFARRIELADSGLLGRREFLLGSAATAAGATLAPWSSIAQSTVGGNLEIMAYMGFSLETETKEWRHKTGVAVRSSDIEAQGDVTAKFVGGTGVRLDLAEYSNGYNDSYRDLGLLREIDTRLIPHYNSVDIYPPFFNGAMWHWDNKTFGIPWVWGVDSILVATDRLRAPVNTYKDLLRPEFAGRICFSEDLLVLFPQMAKVAGYGGRFPNLTKAELSTVFERMQPYRAQAKVFATSGGDIVNLFASREIDACFCAWTALPLLLAKQKVNVKAIYPVEGGIPWVDAWFIPKTAVNLAAAHAYIDQALTPQIQASIAQSQSVGVVSNNAPALMDPSTRSIFDYDHFETSFAKLKIYGQPPLRSSSFATYDDWLHAWEDFKAGF